MKYHQLGQTDMTVSRITLGCWAFAGDAVWGPQDDAESIATIHAALDRGVNFFDTAEDYGQGTSEKVLGKALVGRRDKAIIATKVAPRHLNQEGVQQACEASLRRLQTDYIDLYQIHWSNPEIPLSETLVALEKLQTQGKVRAVGVCNFGIRDMADLLTTGRCETNQLPYNLLWRAIEFEIQQQCVDQKIGILPYSVLGQGLLAGKFPTPDDVPESRARTRHFSKNRSQTRHDEAGCEAETFAAIEKIGQISQQLGHPMARVALAWLLHQPGVTSIIVGARHPEQIQQNAQAVDLNLSPETIQALNAATDKIKQILGPNPDMWQSDSRFN